jgi:hypothetical protein
MDVARHDIDTYLRAVVDAIPSAVMVVDGNVKVHDANRAARQWLSCRAEGLLHDMGGNLLHCVHASEPGGCGGTASCSDCVVRQTVQDAYGGGGALRRTAHMRLGRGAQSQDAWFLVTASPFSVDGERRVLLVMEDVTEIHDLRRIMPICARCHKVRDSADYWHDVEEYLERHAGVEFTHGLCNACIRAVYPDQADAVLRRPGGDTSS